jgi:zinc protease
MAFNGSEHFKGNQLISTLESFGMNFGAHLNAYTSFDETVYQLHIPTDPEKLDIALVILKDWAGGLSFDPVEIDKERGVVIDEWRRRLGAGQRLQDALIPLQFNHSHYVDRLPIGTEESLKSFTREQIVRFYRDWYRPSLMTLIAVGDFDVDQMEAKIKAQFDELKSPEKVRPRVISSIKGYDQPISAVFVDPELPTIGLQISELNTHQEPTTRGGYRAKYIRDIAVRILNERLGELRKQAQPPFMLAAAYQAPLTAQMESRGLMIVPFEGQLQEALNATFTEFKRAQRYGFTQTEVNRAQRVTLSYLDQLIKEERTEESESAAQELVRHVTRGETVPGLKEEAALLHEIAPTVKLSEVNEVAQGLLSGAGWCATLMGPTQSKSWFPDETQLKTMVLDAFKLDPKDAYQDITTDQPLVPSPPEAGHVVKTTRDEVTDTTTWELSNGVNVVLKVTDFEDDTVIFNAMKWGGISSVSEANYIPATQAGGLAASSGLGEFNAIALTKRLAGVQANVSIEISELEVTMSGSSSLSDLNTMFKLLWLNATGSRIDEEEFQTYKRTLTEQLSRRSLSPMTELYDTYKLLAWDQHPRRRPPHQGLVKRANLTQSRQALKRFTQNWSGATFIFVGNLNLEQLKPQIERWIGGLPSAGSADKATASTRGFKDIGARLTQGKHVRTIKRGMEPKAQVLISIHGAMENNPTTRHTLRSLAQVLSIRLREVLREREGGTYSIGAQVSLTEFPSPEYAFTISFGCDPKRATELTQLVWTVIKEIREQPVSKEDVSKVSTAELRAHEVNIKTNEYWLGALMSNHRREEPTSALTKYWSLHAQLTPEVIHKAARRYLQTEPNIQITLLPQESTSKSATTDQ